MTLPSSHPSNDSIINDFNIVATVGGFLFAVMATFGLSVWAGLAFLAVTALLVIIVHLWRRWRRSGSSQLVVIPDVPIVPLPSSTTLLPTDVRFLTEVFNDLPQYPILMLLAQEHRVSRDVLEVLEQRLRQRFGKENTYHLTPLNASPVEPSTYFTDLAKQLGLVNNINTVGEFGTALRQLFAGREKICLFIKRLEAGDSQLATQLAGALRNLSEETHPFKLQVVLFGRQKLAELKYAKDSQLSLLNNAHLKEWPELTVADVQQLSQEKSMREEEAQRLLEVTGGHLALLQRVLKVWAKQSGAGGWSLDYSSVLKDPELTTELTVAFRKWCNHLKSQEQICQWLGQMDLGTAHRLHSSQNDSYQNELLEGLYWCNLLTQREGRLVWRGEVVREVGKMVLCPHSGRGGMVSVLAVLVVLFTSVTSWAVESFPPLVPEGEQLAKNLDGLNQELNQTTRIIKHYGSGSMAFSPDGKALAVAGADDQIRIWEVSTGDELKRLKEHVNKVTSVAYSPDGLTLTSQSEDNTVQVWEVATGRELKRLEGHTEKVNSVAYSPDGHTLATWSDGDNTVHVKDAVTGLQLRSLEGHTNWVSAVAYSPDGHTLASGSFDNTVRIWDIATGQEMKRLKGYTDRVYALAYSPDGHLLASQFGDHTVSIWEVATGGELKRLEGNNVNIVSAMAYSLDGHTLASGFLDHTVRLWDMDTGHELRRLEGHTGMVEAVAYSPSGHTLASASTDDTVRIWEVATGHELRQLKGHTKGVESVAYSPNGDTLASGASDNSVRLWDVDTGRELKRLEGHTKGVTSVAYNPDGHTLASGSDDNSVRFWEIATGQELKRLEGHTKGIYFMVYNFDGRELQTSSYDNTVRLWEVATGRELSRVEVTKETTAQAYSPDGHIAMAFYDGTILILDESSSQTEWVLMGGPYGTWLSCQATGKCWRYDDGSLLKRLDGAIVSPILPPRQDGQLEVLLDKNTLTVAEGQAEDLTFSLHNSGKGRVYWVKVSHDIVRNKDNRSPLIFHPPETTVILEPQQTLTVPTKVSALADYADPRGGQYPLELLITSAHNEPIKKQIMVQTHTPSLQLEKVVASEQGSPSLSVILSNQGQQDLTDVVFTGQVADTLLDKVKRDKIMVGETVGLSFALPLSFNLSKAMLLNSKISLTLWANKVSYPIHQWTFANQAIILPPPPWYLYALLSSLVLILAVLVYYWRVFRHPLVLAVSQDSSALSDLPLEQLATAQRWLRRAGRWETVFSQLQLSPQRWEETQAFLHHPTPMQRCRLLMTKLGLAESNITPYSTSIAGEPWLFLMSLGDHFRLNVERCVLAFPSPTVSSDEILHELQRLYLKEPANLCLIISTTVEFQQQFRQLQLQHSDIMWVIPNNAELTRLLLAAPTDIHAKFTGLIASQVKVTRLSPYQLSGGVKKGNMFFGRHQALHDILHREPRNYLLVGARQVGKSTLLQELYRRYQQHPTVHCFYFSLSYSDLAETFKRLIQYLQLPPTASFKEILQALASPPPGQRYLLLLDEADKFIFDEAQQQYATLHLLRNLSEEGHCYFILAGFWTLYQATTDYQSPIKNFGEVLRLGELEWDACQELATKPMADLRVHYAQPELVTQLIQATGQRANLIAIVCDQLLKRLDTRRLVEASDVNMALDSSDLDGALKHWGKLGVPPAESRLDRIVVYATVAKGDFDLTSLRDRLKELQVVYQQSQLIQSLERLELAFILKREGENYSYRVPVFVKKVMAEKPEVMLEGELTGMSREVMGS